MIYFIHATGTDYVKIGFTDGDPADRMADLQTGSPHELVLLGQAEGDVRTERALHTKFDADRVRGEWFKITPRLLVYIARFQAIQFDAALTKRLDEQGQRITWLEGQIRLLLPPAPAPESPVPT